MLRRRRSKWRGAGEMQLSCFSLASVDIPRMQHLLKVRYTVFFTWAAAEAQ